MKLRCVLGIVVLAGGVLGACGGSGGGTTVMGPVTGLQCEYAGDPPRIVLTWTNPSAPAPSGVLVARLVGTPVGGAPDDGATYAPGSLLPRGGQVVYVGAGETFTDEYPPGGDNHYAVFPYDASMDYAEGAACMSTHRQLVLYEGDLFVDTDYEIYLVDLVGPGAPQTVNAPPRTGSSAGVAALTSTHTYYVTDHDTAGTWELYRVAHASPGMAAKVNGPYAAGTDTGRTRVNSSETYVAYVANADLPTAGELYLVDLAAPGVATKVNPAFAAGQIVTWHQFSPDGSRLLYLADQDTAGQFELYVSPVPPVGVPVKLNPALGGNRDVADAEFSPDGTRILYKADQDADEVREIYQVEVATPGVATKMNATLTPGGDITEYHYAPNGNWIVYAADQAVNNQNEIWRIDPAVPGVSLRINRPLALPAMAVDGFALGPNGENVLYMADHNDTGQKELFLASLGAPGTADQVNGAVVPGGGVERAHFDPRGERIVYRAREESLQLNAYMAQVATPGTSTRMNGALPGAAAGVTRAYFTADGRHILYRADGHTALVHEVYAVPTDSPGASVRLNPPPIAAGGNVDYIFPIP